ncbi:hypothetical protein D9M70_384000 [compost metagenome]
MLEEFGCEPGVGPEQQGLLAVDHAGVQVRHGHRRGADLGLAVDLGLVLLDHFGVVAAQPLAADREAAEALAFLDAGKLQQRQRAAASAEEDEACGHFAIGAGLGVLDADIPAAVGAVEAGDLLEVADAGALQAFEVLQQLVGDRAEVDVGAVHGAGRGDLLGRVAALHHQRRPFGHGGAVFGVFHLAEGMVLAEQLMALLEERGVLLAAHEGEVRDRIDEVPGRAEGALAAHVGPELLGDLELGIDVDGLLDVDGAISRLGRVVQLAEACVAGTRVVPGVGTLDGPGLAKFRDLQLHAWIELFKQYRQRSAHDAGPDQQHVHCLVIVLRHLLATLS